MIGETHRDLLDERSDCAADQAHIAAPVAAAPDLVPGHDERHPVPPGDQAQGEELQVGHMVGFDRRGAWYPE